MRLTANDKRILHFVRYHGMEAHTYCSGVSPADSSTERPPRVTGPRLYALEKAGYIKSRLVRDYHTRQYTITAAGRAALEGK